MTKHIITLFVLTAALTACEEEEANRAPFLTDTTEANEARPAAASDSWDSAPPAVEPGALAIVRVASPFVDGVQEQVFEYRGDLIWERADNSPSAVYKALRPCLENTNTAQLHWTDGSDGPAMEMYGSGLERDFRPAPEADHWRGAIRPTTEVAPRCRAAMKRAGLSWPVTTRLQVVEIID